MLERTKFFFIIENRDVKVARFECCAFDKESFVRRGRAEDVTGKKLFFIDRSTMTEKFLEIRGVSLQNIVEIPTLRN